MIESVISNGTYGVAFNAHFNAAFYTTFLHFKNYV